MEKDITRLNIRDNNMRQVIMRLDFSGILDLKEITDTILYDETFRTMAPRLQEVYHNEMKVQLREDDLKVISKTLSIPINVIERTKILRFTGFQKSMDLKNEVTLDISRFFLCLSVSCRGDYDGFDKYAPIFTVALDLIKNNANFTPQRLGLRKNRVQNFDSIHEVFNVFQKSSFGVLSDMEIDYIAGKHYTDFYRFAEKRDLHVRNRREINLIRNEEQQKDIYQTILDIDCFYKGDYIEKEDIQNLLTIANEEDFRVYKYSMNPNFMEQIRIKD